MLVTDESPPPPIGSAVVTILQASEDASSEPGGQYNRPISFGASVAALQDSLMLLRAPRQTPLSSALKIETADALWLGETEKCELEAKCELEPRSGLEGDSWLIRVRLHHVLRDFDTLARLAERFGTAAPKKVSVQA